MRESHSKKNSVSFQNVINHVMKHADLGTHANVFPPFQRYVYLSYQLFKAVESGDVGRCKEISQRLQLTPEELSKPRSYELAVDSFGNRVQNSKANESLLVMQYLITAIRNDREEVYRYLTREFKDLHFRDFFSCNMSSLVLYPAYFMRVIRDGRLTLPCCIIEDIVTFHPQEELLLWVLERAPGDFTVSPVLVEILVNGNGVLTLSILMKKYKIVLSQSFMRGTVLRPRSWEMRNIIIDYWKKGEEPVWQP